jgi:hypothetical protein
MTGRKYFFCGIFLALAIAISSFSLDTLVASDARTRHDVRFAIQLGVFDATSYSTNMLGQAISESAFNRGLTRVLTDLGFIQIYSHAEMKRFGIIADGSYKTISRQRAVETLFRAIIHGVNRKYINSSVVFDNYQPFYDWIIARKYMTPLGIALENGIIKGLPDGKFAPQQPLKTADALSLFRRFYEAFHKKADARPATKQVIKKAQPAADRFELLQKAGAFSIKDVRNSLKTRSEINLSELNYMLEGILRQAKKAASLSELKYFMHGKNPERSVTREQLAHLSALLLRAMVRVEHGNYHLYADVEKDSALGRSLDFLGRVGIVLGYADHYLRAYERVTWFEAFSILEQTLAVTGQQQMCSKMATRGDIEDFKMLLKTKRARIRRILNRQR